MYYAGLKSITDQAVRQRTVQGLQALRAALSAQVPAKAADKLLLATWNIRELDSGKVGGWRDAEPYHYIAEILGRFDLVAVQELRDGLFPLQRLKALLGNWWETLVTDVTLGVGGNTERMAFLYDRRKVSFTGLAAELVLPPPRGGAAGDGGAAAALQLARTPYLAGFRCGWSYLTLATVHIYYGTGSATDPRRLEEIRALARTLAAQARRLSAAPQYEPGKPPDPDNLIVLGDFNIFRPGDATMQAITEAGFIVPEALKSLPGSNVARNKHYDQIAYFKELRRMRPTGRAGIFDFFEHVYTQAQAPLYDSQRLAASSLAHGTWRTWRMSDHLPMWVEFDCDDADAYLGRLAAVQ